jgi:hypothetical protein
MTRESPIFSPRIARNTRIMKSFWELLSGLFRLPARPLSALDAELPALPLAQSLGADWTDIDQRSRRNILTLDPKLQGRVCDFLRAAQRIARDMGCQYVIISGTRTWAQQDALYAQGRTGKGPVVTRARGGFSNHNFKVAFDCGVFRDGKYLDDTNPSLASEVHHACAKVARQYGLAWGGTWTFRDEPHYQWAGAPATPTAVMRDQFKKTGSVMP